MFKKIMADLEKLDEGLDEDDELLELDESEIVKNLHTYPNERLADLVISYRYMGLYKDLSIAAMQELGSRRANGDTFEYEKYIDENLAGLPKLDFTMQGLGNLIEELQKLKVK